MIVLAPPPLRDYALADRWDATSGVVPMSGIQALVRTVLDLRRADAARGLDTRAFVSGYQGSPLATLDRELAAAGKRLEQAGIVFRPGLNEELAATAVGGTQLLGELTGRRHDGVTGFWYGKAPGLDRAADAIRHANLSGTAPLGGAVAWIGDDPSSKSSTVPSSSEPMCRSLLVPLLAPGTVAEILTLGLHAVALSRHAGTWAALKIVADIADASASVDLDAALPQIPRLDPREGFGPPVLLPPTNLDAEHDLMTERLARAREYASAAGLNRIVFEPRRPRLAIAGSGMGHQVVRRALRDMGLGEEALDALGIRLISLAMPWPLEREQIRRLAAGVETVLVVEDKLPFLESSLRDALYRTPGAPLIVGKEDASGESLLPLRSVATADDAARAIGRLLPEAELPESARARLTMLALEAAAAPALRNGAEPPKRIPYFCSGCPHNTSTRAQPDQLVGVGIGCHTMVALDGGERRGHLLGMPQMGGEGAQWFGLAPFTDDEHFIQNLGDGTFHHSGSLAIRAAVAAGVPITFRLLYNDAVAMTGGQHPEGQIPVPELTRWLALEGVHRVIVTTPEPADYDGVALDPIAHVLHRDRIEEAIDELAAAGGVTVLIHDDRCATEERRLRKRGLLPTPAERVFINERVCEGCGDCGERSSCLSVQPVDTEFGRKTRIHQASCTQDMSCLKGDCPSFLLVTPAGRPKDSAPRAAPRPPTTPPDPAPRVPRDVLMRMPGVGGTGVVTVSAILQTAAHLDGRWSAGLEQIGLAQKGGPVLSDIRIADAPVDGALRAGARSADVLLGLDLLGAAARETLAVCDPLRTVAVLSSTDTPTAAMVTDARQMRTPAGTALARVAAVTRPGEEVVVDAGAISERLFHDHMPANMVLVGAAFQHGCIPLSAAAIERAIELNGTAVETNLAAFGWGRAAVADPAGVAAALDALDPQPGIQIDERALQILNEHDPSDPQLRRVLEIRAGELIGFQGQTLAERYAAEVTRVAAIAHERAGEAGARVALAYAEGLFKLTAYKDEYEVARLHLDAAEHARMCSEFGDDAKVEILLHPPLLRTLGLRRKLRLRGAWALPALRVLRHGRRLRGTPLDPFGHTRVRRAERALIAEYRELVDTALEHLTPHSARQVAEIAALPDVVRGYEEIKLRGIEDFRTRAATLMQSLTRRPPSAPGPTVRRALPMAGAAARSLQEMTSD